MMVKSDKFTQYARVANYDKRLSAAETRVYGVLCDRVIGDTNKVKVNRNFLMKAVGCSATTLTRAIKHLMDLGYIEGKTRNFDKMTGAEEAPTYYLAAFEDIQAEIDPACEWVFNTKTDEVVEDTSVKEPVVEDTPTTTKETSTTRLHKTHKSPAEVRAELAQEEEERVQGVLDEEEARRVRAEARKQVLKKALQEEEERTGEDVRRILRTKKQAQREEIVKRETQRSKRAVEEREWHHGGLDLSRWK